MLIRELLHLRIFSGIRSPHPPKLPKYTTSSPEQLCNFVSFSRMLRIHEHRLLWWVALPFAHVDDVICLRNRGTNATSSDESYDNHGTNTDSDELAQTSQPMLELRKVALLDRGALSLQFKNTSTFYDPSLVISQYFSIQDVAFFPSNDDLRLCRIGHLRLIRGHLLDVERVLLRAFEVLKIAH
jgi:hypothetical protein